MLRRNRLTMEEVESDIREAIAFHVEGMPEDGLAFPELTSRGEYVELPAWPSFGGMPSPPLQPTAYGRS